jgi:predicted permease
MDLIQDFRYALRSFGKNIGLTTVIVLSLAIGIGANTAIFSVVDALLLRPLPYPQPERLAAIWIHSPGLGIFRDWPSPGQYMDILAESHSFEEVSISHSSSVTLSGFDQPEPIDAIRTSSNLFHMLGAKPLLGRLLLPEDDKPGKSPIAILSARLWKRRFSSDPNIVGKSITLNGNPFTVAGVLNPSFLLNNEVMPAEGPMDKVDIFAPLPLGPDAVKRRGDENYNLMARLKPGVSVTQAQADIDIIATHVREKDKRDRTFGMTVIGLQEQVVGDVRRALLVLLGSVALVLMIACANVANLLLARAASRQKEIAIRISMGAGWQRLVRQMLTESLMLAVLGGVGGLVVAQWAISVVRAINPGNIPRLDDISLNTSVMAFTFGVSLITGILFGLAPSWRAARTDLNSTLKSGGRSGQGDSGIHISRHRLRGLLVVSELALSLMLLIGAGLLIRSFTRLQEVPPGFTPDHVLTMRVAAAGAKYREPKAVGQFYRDIGTRISHLAGVKSEGATSGLPLSGSIGWGGINVEGYTPPPGQELQSDIRVASTDYFRAMDIALVKGRYFSDFDTADSQQVAIIDEKFAQRFWPHGNPVGKHLWFDPKKPFTITGVVKVVKQYGLDMDSKIAVYFPHQQTGASGMYLVAKTSSDPAGLSSAIVREIHAVDPTVAVFDIHTMEERVYGSMARQRFAATMLTAFALFALLLTTVGVYGVISYLVSQSRHDLGIRIALGAQQGNILGLVLGQGMKLTVVGVVIGLLGALGLTRVMASLLFGVAATDALTFGVVAAVLIAAAFLATVIPAQRATRVDPMTVLRED